MSTTIDNPFTIGSRITIPASTPVRTTNPRHPARLTTTRSRTVRLSSALPGWIDTMNDRGHGNGYVVLPSVTWAGWGGYWHDVQVTADLLTANGMPPLTLPELDEYEQFDLDVIPSLEPGYTDQWKTA